VSDKSDQQVTHDKVKNMEMYRWPVVPLLCTVFSHMSLRHVTVSNNIITVQLET